MKKYICFNKRFNVQLLKQDLAIATTRNWKEHFNRNDFEGKWESISLRSATGSELDILANCDQQSYRDTNLLEHTPYLKSILEELLFDKEAVRILALYPGGEIKPHRDRGCDYKSKHFRLHIPLQTNSNVHFTVGGERLFLEEGSLWYIDFDQIHSIENKGNEMRAHLVIDGIRNQWTDDLFASHGYDLKEEQEKETEYDEETMLKIISDLEKMDGPAAQAIIAQYKKKLNERA
ncbi:aspartyl/asparaginyl beta-hydroxylase [Pedobacter psychrotolerans]|uniref:Aspartyl/asparaginyl beta-hydroxylase n=1 Tax=Pedobacter psychrotolerans TaxID=1843235 RepID=A0A4V2RYR9_9SPHI|nr:aspartyl/asparaginyl beta-hydroxylase domain-containing protein [Pedobacter psychrotolerans]TCO21436.1 aspartyl/asparaginyl beta-hydroxylase [Pedobacter psychrotolerans]GGE38637.1 aspartyl/asparaginyl beta-hydroxylase [Pedobacter psychrotolerans]